jgi:hypothetical protein
VACVIAKIGPPYHVSTLDKATLIGSSDGILGIHKQVLAKDNAQTHTKSQQGNVDDGRIDVVFLERCTKCRQW